MAERNITMKSVKKIISTMLSGAMALTMCAGTALNVSAVEVHNEHEMQYEPGTSDLVYNDSFETAELLPAYSLYKKTYYLHRGDFTSNDLKTDERDYYKFSIDPNTGKNGQVAIRLDNFASANNFDLYLYDANYNCIDSSERLRNIKDIVTTPAITKTTDYYLEVRVKTKSSTTDSIYNIYVEDCFKSTTVTAKLSPITINATPDEWSPNASRKMTGIPSDATVTKATVSAKKSSSSGGYNHVIRVKLTDNGDYETVSWTSGEVTIPDLVGKNCSGTSWYAGFKASELPQMIAGKPTYLGVVSLNTFVLTVTYEYEVYPEYN